MQVLSLLGAFVASKKKKILSCSWLLIRALLKAAMAAYIFSFTTALSIAIASIKANFMWRQSSLAHCHSLMQIG